MENKANCYCKPTKYVHDSGFRCFEIGYCELGGNNKVLDKLVLGQCSDHLWFTDVLRNLDSLNMDLTKDGYIRFFSHKNIFTWDNSFNFVVSTASLEVME